MQTKQDIIQNISFHLMRISNKHSFIEEHPIKFDENIILTPREVHFIQTIGEHENINVKELGEYFGITKSAASQMVSKLAVKGLVIKKNPAHNNKELQLSLTEKGWKAFRAHERFHSKHMTNLTKRLSSAFSALEMKKTSALLEFIEKILDERIKKLV